MSKKLIAVAAAAALALSGLVGVAPANASVSVAYTNAAGSVSPAASATSATALIDVPANNRLEFTSTSGRSSLMKATVTTVAGQLVSVATTGKVRVVEEPTDTTNKNTSASGVTAWTKTATTTSVVFYVYTTGTEAGSVKTTIGGNSTEVFLKGTAGAAYNLKVTFPTVVPAGTNTDNVTGQVTDVFGNTVSGVTVTGVATGPGSSGTPTLAWDATDERYEGGINGSTTGGALAVQYSITATDVTGLAKAVKVAYTTITSTDLTGLTAQVAALTASVAALTADFNALATKYNKLVKKSKRVAKK
jgi:hypothetical protein